MDNLLPSNEFVEVEDRYYVNPQTQVDEATSFIDQLRATQGQQNQEVTQQTQRLGTDVPTNLGGLTGAESYFTSRLQTPQTAYNIANLRATAQAAALNDVLSNEYSIWKNKYTQAYRNSTKSNSNNGGDNGGGGDDDENKSSWDGETKLESTDESKSTSKTETAPPNPYSDEFNITGEEQTKRVSERSGLPESIVNVLKIFGNT